MIGKTNAGGGENLDTVLATQTTDLNNLETEINSLDDSNCSTQLKSLIDGTATEITIPYGTTQISTSAFTCNYNLQKINIPKTVTKMAYTEKQLDWGLFYRDISLKELDLSNIEEIKVTNTEQIWTHALSQFCLDCPLLERVYFNDNLVLPVQSDPMNQPPQSTFAGCGNLIEVNLPLSLEILGSGFFADCYALKSLIGGWKNIRDLRRIAFGGCNSLDMPELPEGFANLVSYGIFIECASLKWKYLPSTINYISQMCFAGCEGLTEMTFRGEIQEIKSQAFIGCNNLTKFSFPSNGVIPTLEAISAIPTQALTIEVPASLLEQWKTATNWSSLTNVTWVALEGK